jgi:glutathione S-transferase
MPYVHLVIALALLEYFLIGFQVGRARVRYKVPAPAMSGHEVFDRYFRAQMNTLEQIVIFVPAILMFGHYLSAYVAAGLGVLFIIGRALYFMGYVKGAEQRHIGFFLSLFPNLILLVGGLVGAARAIALT